MRISDWSSDVCSSDLPPSNLAVPPTIDSIFLARRRLGANYRQAVTTHMSRLEISDPEARNRGLPLRRGAEARLVEESFNLSPCRERDIDRKSTRLNSSH